jgi:hypothetical protein
MYPASAIVIRRAIEQKLILRFYYQQIHRTVEPHILGYAQDGELTMSAYMLPAKGLENWRSFHVAKVIGLAIAEQHFEHARQGYNPHDSAFRDVIARL